MEQNTVQKPDCAAITAQARQAAEELLGGCTPARRGYFCGRLLFQRDRWRAYWQGQQHGSLPRLCWRVFCPVLKAQAVYLAAQLLRTPEPAPLSSSRKLPKSMVMNR